MYMCIILLNESYNQSLHVEDNFENFMHICGVQTDVTLYCIAIQYTLLCSPKKFDGEYSCRFIGQSVCLSVCLSVHPC